MIGSVVQMKLCDWTGTEEQALGLVCVLGEDGFTIGQLMIAGFLTHPWAKENP